MTNDRKSMTKNQKLSNSESFIHLVKSTLGGGFLAMPDAFRHTGIILGCFGVTVIGAAVLNMMSFLVRCSQALRSGKYAAIIAVDRQERGLGNVPAVAAADPNEIWLPPMSYPETVEAVFRYGASGRFARFASFFKNLTSTMLLCTYYGVNIVYVCIIANTSKQLIDHYTPYDISIHYYPVIVSLIVFPVGMISNLKSLVFISKVATTIICCAAFIIFYFLLVASFRFDTYYTPLKLIVFPASKWSLFAGTTLCSLEGVGMLLKIEGNMINPKKLAGPPTYTLHWSVVFIILINTVIGVLGYISYGDGVLGSISLNLPSNSCLSDSVKVFVAVGIVLSYGLQLNVTADLLWPLTRKIVNHLSPEFLDMELQLDEELTPEQNADTMIKRDYRRLKYAYIIMRIILLLGTIIVATIEPRIEPLISLVGSVGFSILGMIVPMLMETVWYWHPHGEDDDNQNEPAPLMDTVDPVDTIQLECFDVNAPTNRVENRRYITGTRPAVIAKRSPNWRAFKRFVRHAKNIVIFGLAVFALIGGAWFNVNQIVKG